MPRPIWSGSISFGLINIPVKLYGASKERELKFNLLHAKDMSPIRYARICRAEGKEVPYQDVAKGYEYREGDYVILHDEDFAKADLKRTKSIEIFEFVDGDEIDPIYFEKPYYIEPDAKAAKAYILLREALKKSKKMGVAKYVLRNKEQLGVLKVSGNYLVLDQIRFKDELAKPQIEVPSTKTTAKELAMALDLIDKLSGPFAPEKYKDEYSAKLKKVIAQKAKGKTVKVQGKAPVATKVPDIMEMLRESLKNELKTTLKQKPKHKVRSR